MRPRERRDSGQNDLFRARLDQIVDLDHPLAKLGRAIDWRFLEGRFGAVYSDKAGHPPLPTRLMAGLSILKHMHDLSDEDLCARWVENSYYQLFCGEEFFQHLGRKIPPDRQGVGPRGLYRGAPCSGTYVELPREGGLAFCWATRWRFRLNRFMDTTLIVAPGHAIRVKGRSRQSLRRMLLAVRVQRLGQAHRLRVRCVLC